MKKFLAFLMLVSWGTRPALCQNYDFFQTAKTLYTSESGNQSKTNGYNRLDSLINLPSAASDFGKSFSISWEIGLFFLEQGKHPVALNIYDKMRSYLEGISEKNNDELTKLSKVYNITGAIYEETGLWNEALGRYLQSLQICDKVNDLAGKARVYNNIGNIYYNRNELNKAEELYLQAIEINKEIDDNSALFDNYVNLGGVYRLNGKYKKALEISLLALTKLDPETDVFNLSIIYLNIGNLHQDMGNNIMALTYYQQTADICLKRSFNVVLIDCYLSMASVFKNLNKVDSSGVYIIKSLKVAEDLGNPQEKCDVLKEAADFYKSIGDYRKSNKYYSAYSNLYDSLVKLNSLTKIEHIQAMYKVINQEKDNEILVQKLNIQQLALQRQRIILTGTIILFLLLVFVLLYLQRNRKRERLKNEYIRQQSELLHQREKEMLLSKEHNLELELEFKKRELTLNVMSLMKINEMLSDISEKIVESAKTAQHQETKDVLKKIGKEVQRSTDAETLKEFTTRFKEVNQDFFDTLLSKYPDLTPSELKLCAFLKLNLTTKEICELTGQNVKAIEVARYRLRVKLGITKSDANLVTFMTQFC